MIRGGADLHRHHARLLIGKKCPELRSRHHQIIRNRPIGRDRADLKNLPFAKSIAKMLIVVVIMRPPFDSQGTTMA